MLRLRSEPFVFIVSGPSGVGKSAVCRGLLEREPRMARVVTVTTRSARGTEKRDGAYHFVDEAAFETMKGGGELIEWASVFGAAYGTPRAAVERTLEDGRIPLLNIDVQGAAEIRRRMPERAVLVFLLPPDEKTLKARLEGRRTDDPEQIERRLLRAREEVAMARDYDYIVVNDDLETCVREVHAICIAEASRTRRRLAGGVSER